MRLLWGFLQERCLFVISQRSWQRIAAAYAVLVFIVSVVPVAPNLAPGHLDKAAHLCEYLLLAWLLARIFRMQKQLQPFWTAWWWATAYGAAIELVQALVPWRSAELMDALTNALGAAAGIFIARFLTNRHAH